MSEREAFHEGMLAGVHWADKADPDEGAGYPEATDYEKAWQKSEACRATTQKGTAVADRHEPRRLYTVEYRRKGSTNWHWYDGRIYTDPFEAREWAEMMARGFGGRVDVRVFEYTGRVVYSTSNEPATP